MNRVFLLFVGFVFVLGLGGWWFYFLFMNCLFVDLIEMRVVECVV